MSKKKKNIEVEIERIYVTNSTDKGIEIGGRILEPGDSRSIPVELEKEAYEKGLT